MNKNSKFVVLDNVFTTSTDVVVTVSIEMSPDFSLSVDKETRDMLTAKIPALRYVEAVKFNDGKKKLTFGMRVPIKSGKCYNNTIENITSLYGIANALFGILVEKHLLKTRLNGIVKDCSQFYDEESK